jgi:hypothetical protein
MQGAAFVPVIGQRGGAATALANHERFKQRIMAHWRPTASGR